MIKVVKIEDDKKLLQKAFEIREIVFVQEQEVDPEIEYEFEEESVHFLAYVNTFPAGTARWRRTDKGIKLERFAVLTAHRRKGLASALINAVMDDIKSSKEGGELYLHAQVSAMPLYQKHGFVAIGDLFMEADIKHYEMVYRPS